MLLILSLFIICTLPSRLVTITMDMVDFRSHRVILIFQFISYILYSLQGTLNPILYSMLAKQWRRNLTQVVRSVFQKNTITLSIYNENEENLLPENENQKYFITSCVRYCQLISGGDIKNSFFNLRLYENGHPDKKNQHIFLHITTRELKDSARRTFIFQIQHKIRRDRA